MKNETRLYADYRDVLDDKPDSTLTRIVSTLDALFQADDPPSELRVSITELAKSAATRDPVLTAPEPHWQARLWPVLRVALVTAALVLALLVAGVGVVAAQHGGLLWQLIQGAPPPKPPRDEVPADKRKILPSYTELTLAEAAREAGFRIRIPSVLPDGLDPNDVTATVSHFVDSGQPLVSVTYWQVKLGPGNGYSRSSVLHLFQLPARASPWFRPENWITPQGDPINATCEHQVVPLRPGVEGLRFYNCSYGGPFLTWTDEGIEFDLQEYTLQPEQALDIARSIR